MLAASYGQLGRIAEAREQATKVLEVHPNFNVESWAAVQPDKYPEDAATLWKACAGQGSKQV